jgi:hypothetical protein
MTEQNADYLHDDKEHERNGAQATAITQRNPRRYVRGLRPAARPFVH